jgi:hypothetical protein
VCALWFGLYGTFVTVLPLTRQLSIIFTGYFYNYPLNSYVVISPAGRGAHNHGFLMHPFGNDSTKLLHRFGMIGVVKEAEFEEEQIAGLSVGVLPTYFFSNFVIIIFI